MLTRGRIWVDWRKSPNACGCCAILPAYSLTLLLFSVCGSQLLLCGSKIEKREFFIIKITINVQFMLYKLQAVAFVSTRRPYMAVHYVSIDLLMTEKVMIVWQCSEEFLSYFIKRQKIFFTLLMSDYVKRWWCYQFTDTLRHRRIIFKNLKLKNC